MCFEMQKKSYLTFPRSLCICRVVQSKKHFFYVLQRRIPIMSVVKCRASMESLDVSVLDINVLVKDDGWIYFSTMAMSKLSSPGPKPLAPNPQPQTLQSQTPKPTGLGLTLKCCRPPTTKLKEQEHLRMVPTTCPPKKIPTGQQAEGHGVVHHGQGDTKQTNSVHVHCACRLGHSGTVQHFYLVYL